MPNNEEIPVQIFAVRRCRYSCNHWSWSSTSKRILAKSQLKHLLYPLSVSSSFFLPWFMVDTGWHHFHKKWRIHTLDANHRFLINIMSVRKLNSIENVDKYLSLTHTLYHPLNRSRWHVHVSSTKRGLHTGPDVLAVQTWRSAFYAYKKYQGLISLFQAPSV